jgi:hypothetical protein
MVFCLNNNTASYHFAPSAVLPDSVTSVALSRDVMLVTNLS